jgi:hypothetical protein
MLNCSGLFDGFENEIDPPEELDFLAEADLPRRRESPLLCRL